MHSTKKDSEEHFSPNTSRSFFKDHMALKYEILMVLKRLTVALEWCFFNETVSISLEVILARILLSS